MNQFNLRLVFILALTAFLAACGGNSEAGNNDEASNNNASNPPKEDELGNLLDVFELDAQIPFVILDDEKEAQTAGFFENGSYIAESVSFSGFETVAQADVTAAIEKRTAGVQDATEMKDEEASYELFEQPVDILKYESKTQSDVQNIQIPLFTQFTMNRDMPGDMDEAQLSNYIKNDSKSKGLLLDEPLESIKINMLIGDVDFNNEYRYRTIHSFNDPGLFLEEVSRTEREDVFPVYTSVNPTAYESWVTVTSEGAEGDLLIYKTPEVIEALGLETGDGLVELTTDEDNSRENVHVTDE